MEKIEVGSLKMNERNKRKISKPAFERLKKSIIENQEYFNARPIIINEKNVILSGHQRVKAAIDLGMKEVGVVRVNVDKKKENEIMALENTSFGSWDFESLDFDLQDIIKDLESVTANLDVFEGKIGTNINKTEVKMDNGKIDIVILNPVFPVIVNVDYYQKKALGKRSVFDLNELIEIFK